MPRKRGGQPGANHWERVLTGPEEKKYLEAATSLGQKLQESYQRALNGIRAVQRGEVPQERDAYLLRDVATILIDCGMRPEECFRLKWLDNLGHIEASSLKKPHAAAQKASGVVPFVLYTFRHTCITRWAKYMDPFTLHVLAGHADMNTTKRYVHPSDADILEAMEKVRAGHKTGHCPKTVASEEFEEPPAIQ